MGCGCNERAQAISDHTGIPTEHVHDFVIGFCANMATAIVIVLVVWMFKPKKKS